MSKITLYKVLGVNQNCNPAQVSAAYNRLVPMWQEQLKDEKEKLNIWLKLAAKAMEVLSDPVKKQEYDAKLKIQIESENVQPNIQNVENTSNKRPPPKIIVPKKQGVLSKAVHWVWDAVWGVLGPIIKLSIRVAIIAAVIWLVFLAEFTETYRMQIKAIAGSAWSTYGPTPKKRVSSYNSLRCEKARMRVAEAKKIKKRYEEKLKAKQGFVIGAVLGSLLKGDSKSAAGIAVAGGVLTKKESYELEKADAFLKGKMIDDLECFKKQ